MKKLLLAAAFLLTVPLSAHAIDITGQYSGQMLLDGLPQPVFLTISNINPGNREAAKIEYSRPRNCSLNWEYGGEVDGTHFLYKSGGYSGWCSSTAEKSNDPLILKLTPINGRELRYDLMSGKTPIESHVLTRK